MLIKNYAQILVVWHYTAAFEQNQQVEIVILLVTAAFEQNQQVEIVILLVTAVSEIQMLFLAEKLENHSGNCMELTLRLFIHHLRLKIIFP